jgi:hypothetical protein
MAPKKGLKKFFHRIEKHILRPIGKKLLNSKIRYEGTHDKDGYRGKFTIEALTIIPASIKQPLEQANSALPIMEITDHKCTSSSSRDMNNERLENQSNKKSLADTEPTLWQMYQNGTHAIVEEIISKCMNVCPVEVQCGSVIIWEGAKLYGTLMSLARTPLVATYFANAEMAISNWCEQYPSASEHEFRSKVEQEIDYAYERSMHICDTY